ncbi:MAG: WYL domain-containing protein, partial [Clostridia bacterium]|nr:WYL domain-containing protein [Clostridia bacterium]
HGRRLTKNIIAGSLEYSEKDDKFRVITRDTGRMTLNMGRITSCEKYTGSRVRVDKSRKSNKKCLVFDVTNERNALERAMLHFAHFEKETQRTGDNTYRVTLYYDWDDETELVIRILSFGPKIKVIEPENFINLIKDRLKRQKSCGL